MLLDPHSSFSPTNNLKHWLKKKDTSYLQLTKMAILYNIKRAPIKMVKLLKGPIPVAKGTLPGRARKSLEKEVMMTMGESKKLFCLKLWLLGKLSLGSLLSRSLRKSNL